MIVVDASVVVEVLLSSSAGRRIAERLLDPSQSLAAPHLLDVEVLQALRRYARAGDLDAGRASHALDDLAALPILRFPHEPLTARIWALRDDLSAYDAAYVALAEALEARLLTRDARLTGALFGAQIEVV